MERSNREIEVLRTALLAPVAEALQTTVEPRRIAYLHEPKPVDDDPAKLLVSDAAGRPAAVVLVAAPSAPDLVERGMQRARDARCQIGERLGRMILSPLAEGRMEGRSYCVLPYRRPLDAGRFSRRYWVMVLGRRIFEWLGNVVRVTVSEATPEERESLFAQPLRRVAEAAHLGAALRDAATLAHADLTSGAFAPRVVLMHGDLWTGNLLLGSERPLPFTRGGSAPFHVIDWPGARGRGHAIYDIVRLSDSMGATHKQLRDQIELHCAELDCEPAHAMAHLAAGLGHLGMNLGAFPAERYAALATRCHLRLASALAA